MRFEEQKCVVVLSITHKTDKSPSQSIAIPYRELGIPDGQAISVILIHHPWLWSPTMPMRLTEGLNDLDDR